MKVKRFIRREKKMAVFKLIARREQKLLCHAVILDNDETLMFKLQCGFCFITCEASVQG
jgi:hypothetical protein